jgi:DNA polymerase-3 subunit beta
MPETIITATHAVLTSALATIKATQVGRPALPILGAVRFSVRDGSVIASGFDYDTLTEVRIGAALPGVTAPLLVNRQALADVTASLIKGSTKAKVANLPVELAGTDVSATFKADGYTFRLDALPAADAPPTDALSAMTGPSVLVDRNLLHAAVIKAQASVGKDDTLPMLTGFKLEIADGLLTIITTDRFRLGIAPVPAQGDAEFSVLAGGNLPAIVKSLPAGPVKLELLGTDHIRYSAGDVTITHRALDVEFVRYRALVPTEFDQTVTISTAKLTTAIQRVSTVLDRGHHLLLDISDGAVTVRTTDRSATSPALPAEVTIAGDFTQGFNPAYLLDALKLFGDQVTFAVTKPGRPALFADSKAALGDDAAFRHLLMPAQLPG